MKKIIFLCLIIALAGCSKKASQTTDSVMVNEEQTNSGDDILSSNEEKLEYGGIVYNAIINDDNVNVRAYPSITAEVLFQVHKDTQIVVIGTSKEIVTIDGYTGNWLNIARNKYGNDGWVFSKYVEKGRITATELKIIEMPPKEEGYAQKLIGSYQINGMEKMVNLYPHKEENQDFYTFAYDYTNESFHYSNIPGSYAWYPETNELKHISYIGTPMESAWVIFTDDFKYLLEDFGTGPGVRGLGVWRVEDSKRIFSGGYYRDINLKGYTINVVYGYTAWNISNNRLDDEILDYGKKYEENNPIPDDILRSSKEDGFGIELIIICELNLDTGIRKIINGRYRNTQ